MRPEPIDPEFLEQWIEALESDQYQKTKFALKKEQEGNSVGQYCCLGVACELAGVDLLPEGQDEHDCGEEIVRYGHLEGIGTVLLDTQFAPARLVNPELQKILASVNDCSETFEPIVKLLRNLDALQAWVSGLTVGKAHHLTGPEILRWMETELT